MTLAVMELAPGAVVQEHRHEREQIGVVLEGSLMFTVDDESRESWTGRKFRDSLESITQG